MNKYQDALDKLKGMIYTSPFSDEKSEIDYNDLKKCDTQLQNDFLDNLYTLQELVDKETPAKPLTDNSGYFPHCNKVQYICPNCGQIMLREICTKKHKPAYCYNCGKKLDWSGEDE